MSLGINETGLMIIASERKNAEYLSLTFFSFCILLLVRNNTATVRVKFLFLDTY